MNHNLRTVFEGYDAQAYTLPVPMLDARRAVDTLEATWPEQPTSPVDARYTLAVEMVTAAREGKPLPSSDRYRQVIRAHEDWTATTEALAGAREQANLDLNGLLTATADTVITEHLARAMAELQSELAEAATLLPEETSDRLMASPAVTSKARAAWRSLDDLVMRYNLIRQAQGACYRVSGGEPDDAGQWAAVDDLLAVWPNWRQRNSGLGGHSAPWPEDARNFQLWMQHRGATFVVLTRAEREQRWHAMYDAEVQERRHNHEAAVAMGGISA